jgi:hypothetical protein
MWSLKMKCHFDLAMRLSLLVAVVVAQGCSREEGRAAVEPKELPRSAYPESSRRPVHDPAAEVLAGELKNAWRPRGDEKKLADEAGSSGSSNRP